MKKRRSSMIRMKVYILQFKRFVRHYEYFFGIWHQTYCDLFFKSLCWIVLLYMWQFQLRTIFWSNFTKACHEILDLYEWFCDQKRSGCCIVCKGSYHCKILYYLHEISFEGQLRNRFSSLDTRFIFATNYISFTEEKQL